MTATHKIWTLAAGAMVLSLCLAACANGNSKKNGAAVRPTEVRDDVAGEEPLPGIVRINRVDRSAVATSGVVRYYVDNVSGQLQEDLSWNVVFMYPPRQQGVNVVLPYDSDVTPGEDLVLVATKSGHEIVATSSEFGARTAKGEKVLATKLVVQKIDLVPMVARDVATGAGTKVLAGKLECVGLSPADDLYKSPAGLWIDFENISGQQLGAIEVKAVFMSADMTTRGGESPWQEIAGPQPGGVQRATLDVARIPRSVARGPFVVKVREKSIFGF